MDTLLQDLRYAIRMLARHPGFTAIAVFTLAVGIGANTAIYSVVDATLLRTLPFRDPGRLMRVSLVTPPGRQIPATDNMIWSFPKYEFFRNQQQVFEHTALYRAAQFNLTGTDEPEQLRGEVVEAAYFPALGVDPQIGRAFRAEEDAVPERDFVALLSHSLWERRFASDPQIGGKTIGLDQRRYTIVGVLPAEFQPLSGVADVWVPVHAVDAADLAQPQSHSWECVARLKAGVTVDQARAAVATLGPRISQAFPARNSAA